MCWLNFKKKLVCWTQFWGCFLVCCAQGFVPENFQVSGSGSGSKPGTRPEPETWKYSGSVLEPEPETWKFSGSVLEPEPETWKFSGSVLEPEPKTWNFSGTNN